MENIQTSLNTSTYMHGRVKKCMDCGKTTGSVTTHSMTTRAGVIYCSTCDHMGSGTWWN